MKPLHAIRPALHPEIEEAIIRLWKQYREMRFRLTGVEYDPVNDWGGSPVEYYWHERWTPWTSQSIRGWQNEGRRPTPEERVQALTRIDW